MAENNVNWGDLLGALAIYMGNRGSAGDTPNFYPLPMSEEDKYWNDARKQQYERGGSDHQQAVTSAARSFFGQLPQTASPRFASPMMQGQQFMGGVQLPRINFGATGRPPTPNGGGGGGREPGALPGEDGRREAKGYGGEDPLNPRGGGGPFGPDPYGLDKTPSSRDMGFNPQSPSEFGRSVSEWWADYRERNPNWMDQGAGVLQKALGLAFGPLASAAIGILRNIIGGGDKGGTQQLPRPSGSIADVGRNAPGTYPAPPTAPKPPRTYGVDPRTGRVYDTGDKTGTQGDWESEWWDRLATPGNPYGNSPVLNMPTRGNRR